MGQISFVGSVSAMLLASGSMSLAADMAVKAPMAAPAPVFSWTGFYIGGNVGGAWSHSSADAYNGPVFPAIFILPPTFAIPTLIPGQIDTLAGPGNKNSFIGGAQAGYNWQIQQVVLGIEADGQGTNFDRFSETKTRVYNGPLTQTVTVDYGRMNWMASIRGRLGWAVDRVLIYGTGGAAVADFGGLTTTVTTNPLVTPNLSSNSSGSGTRWGWTLGAGVEWAFANQWSLAGEYRHADFGRRSVNAVIPDQFGGTTSAALNVGLSVNQATFRVNYRFGGPVVAKY
ncbi:outer membrane protein [Bradyrhizobium sp. WSM1417]|uniref:outer membrane protein n=1 Tax=Bradyrhizobium sp. WSM1417 TaxID=754500 RepID=UPI0004834C2C|nr:outer membrane beta-barrel protein [Bradyrhizobium sp. WSM1417]